MAATAAILLGAEAERQQGYEDGYDPDVDRASPLFGLGGYDDGYDEGEADREADERNR